MAGLRMFVLLFAFASLAGLNAHIAEWDEYWQQRSAEAANNTLASYHPTPEKVVAHLNMHTQRVLKEIAHSNHNALNSTRRGLTGHAYQGPCKATNPIDQCWRCQPNWAQNRFRLADCVLGFGQKTTGGKGGRIYVVDDPSDNSLTDPKPGTLRHAVIQKEPLWIIFKNDMFIKLTQELMMASDKTIDARGARVVIKNGAGITLQYVKNIIIHGLRIHDIKEGSGGLIRDSIGHIGMRTKSDGDGISLYGATDVWIDHVSMTNCFDGLIDAIQGSTGVTISNGHFTDHNEVMLFGGRDVDTMDKKMQITVAFNHFGKRLVQRLPRVRYGYVHVVNNDYTHWTMYAIGGSKGPTIISQGNRYYAQATNPNTREVTKRVDTKESEAEWKSWTWRSEGDKFVNGAFFVESGDKNWYGKHPEVFDKIKAVSGDNVAEMTKFAGSLNCKVGKPC